jgi:hypothetical protein
MVVEVLAPSSPHPNPPEGQYQAPRDGRASAMGVYIGRAEAPPLRILGVLMGN